jgi:gamma-glutamyltranspeptidase / glutathione hydrolase
MSFPPPRQKSNRPLVMGTNHVVAAGHYLSALAGMEMLEAGGNAVDAGVAAGIATGVLEGTHVSVAGVAPIIIRMATGTVETISGLGWWPAAATPEYFTRHFGGKIPVGVGRTVIPAAPDAWITALERHGTMSFADVAAPSIRVAREGFPTHAFMSAFIAKRRDMMERFPSTAAIYLPGGHVPAMGEVFVQTDLAATLQYMADEEQAQARNGRAAGLAAARASFYRGDIAKKILAFHREQGGLFTARDLAEFRVGIEKPVEGRFGDMVVWTCGPWCQGPMLLQTLNLLDPASLLAAGHNSPAAIHAIAEAIKLAAADREAYYGDPRFMDVPIEGLVSADYAAERRRAIDPDRAAPGMPAPGSPSGEPWRGDLLRNAPGHVPAPIEDDESSADTSYLCAVDRWGNAFSATPSDGNTACPVIPGTGFVASGRGSQSRADPGHPTCLAPGKRPRLTPNPAIAMKPGEFVLPFGTPGGDVQVQAMVQCLVNLSVYGMDPQSAIEAPRFASYSFPSSFAPFDYRPGVLAIESRVKQDVIDALAAKGHVIEAWPDLAGEAGSVCMIHHDLATGVKSGAADPRRTAYAIGR